MAIQRVILTDSRKEMSSMKRLLKPSVQICSSVV